VEVVDVLHDSGGSLYAGPLESAAVAWNEPP
jgi:hypothetical protein